MQKTVNVLISLFKTSLNVIERFNSIIEAIKNIMILSVVLFLLGGAFFVYYWQIKPFMDNVAKKVTTLEQTYKTTQEAMSKQLETVTAILNATVQASRKLTTSIQEYAPNLQEMGEKAKMITTAAEKLTSTTLNLEEANKKLKSTLSKIEIPDIGIKERAKKITDFFKNENQEEINPE